jgi:thiol-disulfide isomerase/thioredoxin
MRVRHDRPPFQHRSSDVADLFIRDAERVYGPYSPARIKQLAAAGRITASWWIGKDKEGPWMLAGKVNGLLPAPDANGTSAAQAPEAAAPNAPARPVAANRSSAASVPNNALDSITTWLCFAGWISLATMGVGLLVTLSLWSTANTAAPNAGKLMALAATVQVKGVVSILVGLATLTYQITFFVWLYQAVGRLRERPGISMRFTPGWAVGWFFVPVASLYKPFQAMHDVWRGSHGKTAAGPTLVNWWWGIVIAWGVLFGLFLITVIVNPFGISINLQCAADSLFSILGAAERLLCISIVTRVRDAFRTLKAYAIGVEDEHGGSQGRAGSGGSPRTLLLSLLVAAVLVPCVFLIGWRTNQSVTIRQDAALPTGWYLEDLPDAVEQSKREGKDLLVLFTADWCGPCRRLKRDLASAEAFRRGVLICVIDCDKQKALSNLHQVQGIPDLRLYRKGAEVKRKTGYGGSLADLETWQKGG